MKFIIRHILAIIAICSCAFISVAEAQVTYTVGGEAASSGGLTGLGAGKTVILVNNGSDSLPLSSNGDFTFATPLASGSSYSVTIAVQPGGQLCSVANGSGTVSQNVTNISVNCVSSFTVGGTVTGLSIPGLVLKLNNAATKIIASGASSYAFSTSLPNGAPYAVSVGIQPAGYSCTVTNGTGTIGGSVTNANVNCEKTYTVGGSVSGLTASGLILKLNGTGTKIVSNDAGYYVFSTALTSGSNYTVTIQTQPSGLSCSLSGNSTGTIGSTNVTDANVSCSPSTYTVGGNIIGLGTGKSVTLLNNGSNALTVSANGTFTFTAASSNGATYGVTVGNQPAGQTCLVNNGSGTVSGGNVTSVSVSCSTNSYTVGGSVSNLAGSLTIENNGEMITLSSSGSFTFPTPVLADTGYLVLIDAQPAGQTCSVTNGSGTIVSTNVTSVSVSCVTSTYTIAGNVFGLSGTLKLQNNGGNEITVNADGGFIFTTPLNFGSAYAVTISAQPAGQTCAVSFGSGTNLNANVWGVIVTCSSNTFAVSGTYAPGGMSSNTVTLTNTRNNGTENLSVSANGTANSYPWTFVTTQAAGSTYNITSTNAGMNPCVVSNGMGVVTKAVTGVTVICGAQAAGSYYVRGTASGIATAVTLNLGSQSVVLNPGATGFTFPSPLAAGSYSVVATQPATQACAVTNGNVTLDGTQDVTNVSVVCVSNSLASSIGGTVSGLDSGKTVTLLDNGGDALIQLGNGSFTFGTRVVIGTAYSVTVGSQPIGQVCTVTNGAGTSPGNNTNVTNVSVACAADTHTYTVGGSITGLSSSVTLLNNGGDNLVVGANGSFTFATALNSGANYSVTIGSQPAGQTCFLLNNSGSGISSNVNSVSVACSNNTYQVGGNVSNLNSGGLILQLGKQTLELTSGTASFTFNSTVPSGDLYSVLINTQPIGQTCSLTNPSGVMGNINVTNVAVSCAAVGAASSDYNVVLGQPTESSVTVSILGGNSGTGDWGSSAYVDYSTTSGGIYTSSATVNSPVTAYPAGSKQPVIEVKLTGLAANTKYFYRVNYKSASGSTFVAGNEHSFYTQRAANSTFSFGVQGDSHPERYNDKMFHSDLYKLTMAEIAKRQPDMYFMLGDDFSSEKMVQNFDTANYPSNSVFPYSVYGPGGTAASFAQYSLLTAPFVQLSTGEGDTKATGSGTYLEQRQKYLGLMAHSTHLFMVDGNHEQTHYVNLGGVFNNNAVFAASARNKFYPEPLPVDYNNFTGMGSGFYSGDTESFATGHPALNGYPGVDGDGLLRDYYAFEWGDALFITIDPYWHSPNTVDTGLYSCTTGSSLCTPGKDTEVLWGKTMGDAQYFWLKNMLERNTAAGANRKKYVFLFTHHINGTGRGGANNTMVGEFGGNGTGEFAANRPTWSKPIHQLLVDNKDPNGATIFFQAHDHTFARETVDGVVYQSVANPADNSYWSYNCSAYAPPTIPAFPSEYSGYGQYNGNQSVVMPGAGYIHVTVSPQLVKLQYIRTFRSIDLMLDANKALYDSLSGHANGEVAFSYSLPAQPGDDQAADHKYSCKGDAPPLGFVYNHYSVGGNVTGLGAGKFVTLMMNGATPLTLSGNGTFTIPTTVNGGAYAVTVASQPAGQTCTVSSGSGNITNYPNGANVTNVSVSCN